MFRYFVSGESMIYSENLDSNGESVSSYGTPSFQTETSDVFKTPPTDMVTLEYVYKDESTNTNVVTGHLKIITRNEKIFGEGTSGMNGTIKPLDNKIWKLNGPFKGVNLPANYDALSVYGQIVGENLFAGEDLPTQPRAYPKAWKWVQYCLANSSEIELNGFTVNENPTEKCKDAYSAIWTAICPKMDGLYEDIQKSAPVQLAYRYQKQVFGNMVDGNGVSVVDYSNKDSSVKMAALPIQNAEELNRIFNSARTNIENLSAANSFSYNSCIIDLKSDEQSTEGKFPMKFFGTLSDINTDLYKKDKLLLLRVPNISGRKFDTFEMGSHSSDYDLVTDMEARKYRDPESNPDGAIDDHITVTLGNGGSYQKKKVNVDKNTDVDDLYAIKVEDTENSKYQRNKHFFIDPFELTIAQWCHIHEKHDVSSARDYLNGKIQEMRRSYWTYLSIWEKDEWEELKREHENGLKDNSGIVHDEYKMPSEDEAAIEWLILHDDEYELYNPLDDTRPYYYATYNEVRGTGKIFKDVGGRMGSNYVIDSTKGDEFQMNSRTGTTSFMDILNNKVVYETKPRKVEIDDVDGGEVISYEPG